MKVLKGTHLPVEIKEIQVGYLYNPYFKDLYLYLSQNKLPSSRSVIRSWKLGQKIYPIRFAIVQNITRKRDCSSGCARNICK